ncbi:MAG: NAD(P)/FAD-dependent oxidoreductase [Proteobacteria bacterium]|nr:NAD(P)/FAD-dependent oxidoreductase [Pseudomonadota bacterium]HQR04238.1 NAD(P)/FAD-dependent oxidoreductase [Rhodocyclaceae bacterium]
MTYSPRPQRDLRFIVIGAGMAGILAAIRLKEAGYRQIVVYEKADRIGGTWRENTYPGLNCDVPAHAYTYSFAPHAEWSHYLAAGPEIQAYFEGVTKKHGIEPLIRFNQEVTACVFENDRWKVETSGGIKDEADVVIAASGVLHHPNIAQIPGMDTFRGPSFHSARWDHSVPLDGRRIAIIGSGSTGAQLVSGLVDRCERVVHVQRSPQWIMPVENPAFTEEQKAAFRRDPALIDAVRYNEEYVTNVRLFTEAIADMDSPQIKQIEAAVLDNLERSVKDPVLREKLRPDYRAACKRLIFSPDYYDAIQRPNAVAAVGKIERIEPTGVRMKDGTLHEVDIIVLATGFQADRFIRPTRVIGKNGVDLDHAWALRPSAYLAVTIPDFPNFFMLNGPTGPVGNFSLIDIAELQWGYIAQLIAEIDAGRCRIISPTHAAMADYETRRIAAAKHTIFGSGCSSWYLDAEGVPASWPWSYDAFIAAMAHPKLEAFDRV